MFTDVTQLYVVFSYISWNTAYKKFAKDVRRGIAVNGCLPYRAETLTAGLLIFVLFIVVSIRFETLLAQYKRLPRNHCVCTVSDMIYGLTLNNMNLHHYMYVDCM